MKNILDIINSPLRTVGGRVNGPNAYALPYSDEINWLVLAAGTAETFTLPDDCDIVMFSATEDFVVDYSGGAAVFPSADVTDGSGGELNPIVRYVSGLTSISIVSAAVCKVCITCYSITLDDKL